MGFFSAKATCAICGCEVGLNRYKITGPAVPRGMELWKCPQCAKKGGLLSIDQTTGKVILISNKDTEVRKKCNICGNVFCYTYEDLEKNKQLAKGATMHSVSALLGPAVLSATNVQSANDQLRRITDYSKCPQCGSRDIVDISKEELEKSKSQGTNQGVFAANELKKYKELLDIGVISQEEFDAKKKQLLGL